MTELLPPDALPEVALIEPFVIGPISAEALAALAAAMDFAGAGAGSGQVARLSRRLATFLRLV